MSVGKVFESMKNCKLHVESLEERTLLAVVAGGEESAVALVAPPEPTEGTIVVSSLTQAALQSAIKSAPTGSTITFAKSGTITLTGTQLEISKSITIDASSVGGITINANQKSRVFYVSEGASVELNSLTITGGKVCGGNTYVYGDNDGLGGGIYSVGTLTLTHCSVTGNTAEGCCNNTSGGGYGGGIYSTGAITLTDCAVTGNTAKGDRKEGYERNGSGVGGAIFNEGPLTLIDCSVTGNTAEGDLHASGGGICCYDTLTLTNCTIEGNTALIHAQGHSGQPTIGSAYGGGIYSLFSLTTLTNCTVAGNAVRLQQQGKNHGWVYCGGGGIYSPDIRCVNSSITDNSVEGNAADVDGNYTIIVCRGGGIEDLGSLTLTNCTVAGNTVKSPHDGWCGGIYAYAGYFYNTILVQNTASSGANDLSAGYEIISEGITTGVVGEYYAYNTLSSFADWTESTKCPIYNPSRPLFTNSESGDYTLTERSQAIDQGNSSYISGYNDDLNGNPRIVRGIVDLGAYEYQLETIVPDIYVEQITIPNAETPIFAGEEVRLIATIKENTKEHNLNDYELKNVEWTIRKLDEHGENSEIVKRDIVVVNSDRWAKVTISPDEWEIHYTGWQPQVGDHGEYIITAKLNYKVKGNNWSTDYSQLTFSSEASLCNFEVKPNEQPDVTVENITISCNDPVTAKNHPDWGPVVGKYVRIVATIQENTEYHDFSDYELKNMEWRIEKLNSLGDVVETVKTDIVSATSNRWAKVTLSDDKWEIHYTGWLPKKGDHGSYKITCNLNYEVKGTNWVSTLFSETFSSSQTLDEAKVDVTEYAVAWAKPKWDKNGSLVRDFNDDVSTLAYDYLFHVTVDREWYENIYLANTGNKKTKQTLISKKLGLGADGITYCVPSDSCYLVFGAAGKDGKIDNFYDLLATEWSILSTPNREKGCYTILFDYSDPEALLKQDDFDNWQEGHRATVGNPKFDMSKPERVSNQKWIQTGNFVEKEFNTSSGLDAFGLSPIDDNRSPVLLFPGTDTRFEEQTGYSWLADALSDANPDGVGYDQYSEKRVEMESWAVAQRTSGSLVNIYGYSLGAALSQWFVANYHGSIGEVELYNAPGISREAVDYYKNRHHSFEGVTYHIAIGDLVSMAGEAYLPGGTVYLYTNSNQDYSCIDYHLAPMVTRDAFAFTKIKGSNLIKDNVYKNTATRVAEISSEEFGSYWFNYNSSKYYDTFIEPTIETLIHLFKPSLNIPISLMKQRVPFSHNLFVRGTTEYERSHVGLQRTLMCAEYAIRSWDLVSKMSSNPLCPPSLVFFAQLLANSTTGAALGSFVRNVIDAKKPVDLSLSHDWTLKYINENLYGSGNVQGSPMVTIRTPDGISTKAFVSYAGYGLDEISVNPGLFYFWNSENYKVGSASIWLPNENNGTLSFTASDGSAPIDVYRDTDYMLSGNVNAIFGSAESSNKMAEFNISSIEAAASSSTWNISDIKLYYNGKIIAELGSDDHEFTATKRGKRLTGNSDLTLTIYDYVLNSTGTDYDLVRSERTFSDSTLTFVSGLQKDLIRISTDSENGALMFQYSEGNVPILMIGSTFYSYNPSMNDWHTTASKPVVPQLPQEAILPDPQPTGLSGSVTANASGYEISVKIPKSTFDSYSLVSFYMDSNNSGFDGDYITSLAKSDMTFSDGCYTYSFDLSETDVEPGAYYLCAHGDFEGEEQSVYSNSFSLTRPLRALTLSETTCQFSDTNIGTVDDSIVKQFTVTNSGETDVTFVIAMAEDSNYLDFLCTAQLPDGSYLTTPTVTLSPGETLSLDIYFVPQTVGDKAAAISLLSDSDDSELGTISITGKALEMLPADLETSAADATVSPQSVCAGDAFDVSCTIFNNSANTADCSSVSFYASQDASDITAGTLIGIVDISEWLLSGESKTVTLSFDSFPQLAAGNYYIGWVVECSNDSNLSDNSAVLTKTIRVLDGQLAVPTIQTGTGNNYVSYGANRHQIIWNGVDNASKYELQYSENGIDWITVTAYDTSAVVSDLAFGADVTYRVRALGTGSYAASEWSVEKTFNVCPMDINGDGDISSSDRVLLASAWLTEEGDDGFLYAADINADGDVSNSDRALLSNNWLGEIGDDDLVYPNPKPTTPIHVMDVDIDITNLNSNPDSIYTIYLDFDGNTTTTWTNNVNEGASIVTPRFTIDGDTSKTSFTDVEKVAIYQIWQGVAEDFMPFDVNVTTAEPSQADFLAGRAQRVAIGGSNKDWYSKSASNTTGVSYIGSFSWHEDNPNFVFSECFIDSNRTSVDAASLAATVSHEVGHALGLRHMGYYVNGKQHEYFGGANGWGPLMGNPDGEDVTQWSRGDYQSATRVEDELEIITTQNGFGYRDDDYADSFNGAATLTIISGVGEISGIIERNTDIDYFTFQSDGSELQFRIGGIKNVTNLDVLITVYNSKRQVLYTYNPSDRLDVEFVFSDKAGTYYLSVEGTGLETDWPGIYSDYGSLGTYSISVGYPNTFVVTTLADTVSNDGFLSLREAVLLASEKPSTILFDDSLSSGTICLTAGQIELNGSVIIDASDIGGITIDAQNSSRVFMVNGIAMLCGLTITGGYVNDSICGSGIYNKGKLSLINCTVVGNSANYNGGGIYNGASALLELSKCAVTGNCAIKGSGGGIYNMGELSLNNCAVTGNNSDYRGGGIYNMGELSLINCTVAGNRSDYWGGGICNSSATAYIYNTVIAQNTASSSGNDIYSGTVYGYNTLSSFTGWTESVRCLVYDSFLPLFSDSANGDYSLINNSQAVNKGNNGYISGITTDIIDNVRISGGTVDIGAYEYQGSSESLIPDLVADDGGSLTLMNSIITLKTGTISNVGNGDAVPGFTISVYASTDKSISVNDVFLKAFTITSGLSVGSSMTREFSINFADIPMNELTAGASYYIGWIISDVEDEVVINNNTAYCSSTLTIPAADRPDLSTSTGGTLSTLSNGKFTLTTATIKNVGKAAAPAGFTIKVYASADTTITKDDTWLASYTVDQALAAGSSKTYKITDIPVSNLAVGGSYYIGWIVSDVEDERVLDNNAAYCKTQLTVPSPDLAASNGGSVTSPANGKFTLKTGTIRNAGKAEAPAGFRINIYASTDTSITSEDILLTSYTVNEALGAGKSKTFTIDNVPSEKLASGQNYYIGWIITDVDGETVITNNTAYCGTRLKIATANTIVLPNVLTGAADRLLAADIVFSEFASADLGVDLDMF